MAQQGELFGGESTLPSGLAYVPEFITREEERRLLAGIATLELREAQYKEYTAKRRVASFGAGYDFTENELTPAPTIAPFLLPLREKLAAWLGIAAEEFGYALVSEYRPGTELGWHRDVPHFELVAGVSLAGTATMRFRPFPPRKQAPVFTLPLTPRSAYVLRGEARWKWQHGIVATPQLRYSITFRTRVAAP
ncbi:MAG TPA: alpha-ketoglutarate-dependent dioxygenase AlkB [Usitatibacter sp.]|nr:alpha-ketoglutarate-dependent dioxygenase AlkB [Usitatibacter sp.]